MKNCFILILLLTVFAGCSNPSQLPVFDIAKPADIFARAFVDKIIRGQPDSCFSDIAPESLTDTFKSLIINASHSLKDKPIKQIKIVDEYFNAGALGATGKFENYRLGYEYQLENSYVVFTINLEKKEGKFLITSFGGNVLMAPLKDLTAFTLKNRSSGQYVFLVITILVPLFILASLIGMLFSKIPRKKKIAWTFIILLISLPRFSMNWGTGQVDFNLLNINLFGASIGRPNLISYWIISFNFPIGAVLFWVNRQRLLSEPDHIYDEPVIDQNILSEDDTLINEEE
jgi:hypothetical protein